MRWLLLIALAAGAHAAPEGLAAELHSLVTDWQTAEAQRRLTPALEADPTDSDLRFVQARLLFFDGRYKEAFGQLEALATEFGDRAPEGLKQMLALVGATHNALKDFDELITPDGRFLIRYQGRDKVLMPYLVEVLQHADRVLAEDFGYRPEGRVVVDIYPRHEYLAKVSPLSEKDIETSGTIALCKYNRLMFTSPRGLVRGYGWRDTVAHEFVHYYVTKLSSNTVPIWLHEGIAKFQESRWRTQPGHPLDPPQEDLLARSLKADQLVTFEQMHPSMALLPSQQAAALAFAEVHTVIDYLHGRKGGYEALRTLLGRLRAGDEMDAALKRAYGVDLAGLWTQWKRHMKTLGLRTYPGLVQTSLRFKRPGQEGEPEPEYDTIEEKKTRDYAHLGELLRARERHKGALVEYRKAMVTGGEGNPVIQNGAAASMLAIGKPPEVPEVLETVKGYYPDFFNTHLHLGEAFLQMKRSEEAIAAFQRAVGINPFHPRPHQALAKLYAEAGRKQEAARERKSVELLK